MYHTPPPWKIKPARHDRYTYQIYSENSSGSRWIADCHKPTDSRPDTKAESEANAKALQLAPEMLKALYMFPQPGYTCKRELWQESVVHWWNTIARKVLIATQDEAK